MKQLCILTVLALSLTGCSSLFGDDDRVSPRDILTDRYDTWVIEIDYEQGHAPSQSAIDLLVDRVRPLVNKDVIDVRVAHQGLAISGERFSQEDLHDLRSDHQDYDTSGDRVVTYVLYVGGTLQSSNQVLGVAFGHEYVVLFDGAIESNTRPTNPASLYTATEVERAVLVHEFGHILGLVDNGVEMVVNHSDGNGHSTNQDSVMHAAVETLNLFERLSGGLPTQFDANDRADLCNAGGRCAQGSADDRPLLPIDVPN